MPATRHITTIKRNPNDSSNLIICLPIFNKLLYNTSILPYKNVTLVEHQIDTLLRVFPKAELFLIIGHESEKVIKKIYKRYRVRFITNDLHQVTNTVYGLSLAIQASHRSSLLVIHGNVLFDDKIGLNLNQTQIITGGLIKSNSVGIFNHEGFVTGFSYSFKDKWSKIALLCNREFEDFAQLSFDHSFHNLFDYELYNKCIEKGGQFKITQSTGLIKEVDTYNDLR